MASEASAWSIETGGDLSVAGRTFRTLFLATKAGPNAKRDHAHFRLDVEYLRGLSEDLATAHRGTDSFRVAPGTYCGARNSGFCREELIAWCEAEERGLCAGTGEKRASRGRDKKEMEEAQSTIPRDGTRRPVVQRIRLPDAGELELCATGGGQGRAPGEGREPAIRGDLSERRTMAGTSAV